MLIFIEVLYKLSIYSYTCEIGAYMHSEYYREMQLLNDCLTLEENSDSRLTVHLHKHCHEEYLDVKCHY